MPRVLVNVDKVIEGARVVVPEDALFVTPEPGSLLRLDVPAELSATGVEFDVVLRVRVAAKL